MNKKNIYVAGGWFTDNQKKQLDDTVKMLKANDSVGNLFIPEEQNKTNQYEYNTPDWAHHQFKDDVNGIDNADLMVATLKDGEIDDGTVWEIGYAFGKGKPIMLVTDAENINLMEAVGNTYHTHNVEELKSMDFNMLPVNFWTGLFF